MASEPAIKRAVAFVDGQNLFYAAKIAFGYPFPNYDVRALTAAICGVQGWQLDEVRFYTGIPDASDNAFGNHFWTAKLGQMGRDKINVFPGHCATEIRPFVPQGQTHTFLVGSEKGVDVRLAIDVVRLAHRGVFDVALVLSQDQEGSTI